MKARDIIPGWPRGRSTVGPTVWRFLYGGGVVSGGRFREDLRCEEVEYRRKAAMMALWYAQRMNEATGNVADERMERFRVAAFGVSGWVNWRTLVFFRERIQMLWWPGSVTHSVGSDTKGIVLRWHEQH